MHLPSASELAQRDYAALDNYMVLPQVLHHVETVNYHSNVGSVHLASPYIQLLPHLALSALSSASQTNAVCVPAQAWLESAAQPVPALRTGQIIARLEPASMGAMMRVVRQLSEFAQPLHALCLDLAPLAHSHPYGTVPWRPRGREELAELKAAATCPLWLSGVASPHDAEVAAEAGVDAIIVNNQLGVQLASPATIDLFPEIFDAVAGMTSILVASNIRHGLDVFRYLAVGAEAVLSYSDRNLQHLHDELAYVMRLSGCATLADISYEALYVPLFRDA